MGGTIYAHMPRCCTSAHEEPTIPTILHRQPSPPLVLMCHRTLLRPAAVLDVPVRDQAAPHCEAIARVNWGTRAAGTDADVPEPQRIPAQGPAHRRRHVVPCESLGAIVLEQHWGIAKSGYALRVRWEPTHHDHAAHCCPYAGPRAILRVDCDRPASVLLCTVVVLLVLHEEHAQVEVGAAILRIDCRRWGCFSWWSAS